MFLVNDSLVQVKEFRAHTAPVNDLSFDTEGEYIGSCSDDGSVVINSLFTDDEKLRFDYHRPMKAISLDPDYTKKQSKRFVAGGLAGHLYMNSKKWFGYKDQVCENLCRVNFFCNIVNLIEGDLVGAAFWGRSNPFCEMERKSHCVG